MKKANLAQVAAELNARRVPTEVPSEPESNGEPEAPRPRRAGPRGGLTTVTPGGLFRTTAYFTQEERGALRRLARERERPYAELIREAVRLYLGMP